jgi:hypothetical protein
LVTIYQFLLTFSGWKSADVVLGSESFVALADGCETLMGELSIKRDIQLAVAN